MLPLYMQLSISLFSFLSSNANNHVAAQSLIQPSTYTVPGAFPTSAFSKYYNNPTATSAQPQPVISDPVTHETFEYTLTNADTLPSNNTHNPHPLPPKASSSKLLELAIIQIDSIINNPIFGNNTCARCQAGLEVAKFLALAAPEQGPELAVTLCNKYKFSSTCENTYGALTKGGAVTQVIANADAGGYDGQMICHTFLGYCPLPPTSPLNLTGWFAKPKPSPLPAPKAPSGKRLKVLHVSDMHLDARYATGAEANCTSSLCCRSNNFNTQSPNKILLSAPRYGYYRCDSPVSLVLAALKAIPQLAGTEETGFAWTLYTGDLVSHDPENESSRELVEYTETMIFDLFKRLLGSGPVYATMGNHDSYNQDQDAPYAIGEGLADQFQWHYDHLAGLWEHEEWLPEAAIQLARTHYAGYAVKRADGLRIISLNTNLWFRANFFNYINMTSSDPSGMMRFLTDQLQEAEDANDRVWIIGHVPSGWSGQDQLLNPSNLFYQIVDRFSPHVIASIFWGHVHEDEASIFYTNNGTDISAETAGALAWMGPSITPLTNINSGFRVYEIDSSTFEVLDAHTWKADVNSFASLDGQLEYGPTYAYEYNTRETYGGTITSWGPNDPLNGTWWHHVTEAMEANSSLVQTFTTYMGKSSVLSPACNDDCVKARICYLRSGKATDIHTHDSLGGNYYYRIGFAY